MTFHDPALFKRLPGGALRGLCSCGWTSGEWLPGTIDNFDVIDVAVSAHLNEARLKNAPPPETVTCDGPVTRGNANGARLAWGNRDVDQREPVSGPNR